MPVGQELVVMAVDTGRPDCMNLIMLILLIIIISVVLERIIN